MLAQLNSIGQENNSLLAIKKLEFLLEQIANKNNAAFEVVTKQLAQLTRDVSEMKRIVASSPQPQQAVQPIASQSSGHDMQQQIQQIQPAQQTLQAKPFSGELTREQALAPSLLSARGDSDQQLQPRFGNFTSNDVPIDKFFYYGGKR